MKTRKSSLSLILALVMVFVMASGALAGTQQFGGTYATTQTVTAGNSATASEDIAINVNNAHGLRLQADTTTDFTTHTLVISKDGSTAGFYGMRVDGDNATLNAKGSISTAGRSNHGINVPASVTSADLTFSGTITMNDAGSHGIYVAGDSNKVTMNGEIKASHSASDSSIYGLYAINSGRIDMTGDITVSGPRARAVVVGSDDAHVTVSDGTLTASGGGASGVYIVSNVLLSSVYLKDVDIIVHGEGLVKGAGSFGLSTGGGIITMENGSVTMTAETQTEGTQTYAMWSAFGGEINITNVTVDALYAFGGSSEGVLNATDSTLTGDVRHHGTEEGTLEVNLTDSVWNGAAEAIDDIGVINVDLVNSQWNVTGDTNTNGKITGDVDSKVDFNGTDENITVIIDRLEGESGISVKPGDKLIIKNPAGNVESSNPDVIEVITNDDGSVEIISKGDGEADLTYEYVDEDGKIKEVTVTVVSGAGSQPAGSGGGGSSNCNTGVGAALFALFGLALIQKRK